VWLQKKVGQKNFPLLGFKNLSLNIWYIAGCPESNSWGGVDPRAQLSTYQRSDILFDNTKGFKRKTNIFT
jgi:hypothetical protein